MEKIEKITDDHWNRNVWHTSEGVAVISEDDYDRLVEKLIKNLGDIGDVSGRFYSDTEIAILKEECYQDGVEEGEMNV